MIETIRREWENALQEMTAGPFFRKMGEGTLTLAHYLVWLRETYYNTRENPTSFALMAGHLKGKKRSISTKVFRHCAAEYGHHDMALDDLRALGADVAAIPGGRPLPTTEALIAFAIYHVQHGNPLSYLGYVYHLEMLPAMSGRNILESLSRMGIPKEGMSFLMEHAQADVGHSKWLEEYFRETIESEEDMQAVLHGVKGTCKLHGIMLQGVLDCVERPADWQAGKSRIPDAGKTVLN